MLLVADAALVAMLCSSGGLTEAVVDTSYGRLDGDSAIAFSAGAAIDARGARGVFDLRYRYLHSAGIFVTYEDGFGAGSEPLRLGIAGLELRPLFLARFLQQSESGSPRLDLAIDSFGIELGAFVAQPANGDFGDGYGLSLAFAFEIPILPHIDGPFVALRAGLRWSHQGLSAADSSTVDVRAFVFTIAFGWQATFGTHVIDVGDVRR